MKQRVEVAPENMAADTHIDLTQYFTSDQLKFMSTYESTRNENLIRNYEYMKSIGRCILLSHSARFQESPYLMVHVAQKVWWLMSIIFRSLTTLRVLVYTLFARN